MPTIEISDELFARLESYAVGFVTPSIVVERLLNEYEQMKSNTDTSAQDSKPDTALMSTNNVIYNNPLTFLPKNEILKMHDEIFQFLLEQKIDFMPRQKRSERLSQGYWFLGDDNYLVISFYAGNDDSNKTPNITFQIYLSDFYLKYLNRQQIPTCVIQLSNTPNSAGWHSKIPVIDEIKQRLGEFEVNRITDGIEARWNRYYQSKDYLKCLEEFLFKDKPIIDDIIKQANNPEIGFLNKRKSQEKINNIIRQIRLLRGE
jgi:hypothetical protein